MVQRKILIMDPKNILIAFILCLKICCGYSNKFSSSSSASEPDNYLLQKEHILEKSYHGLIRENETFVEITPLIKVDEQKVCDFRILKKSHHEIPFRIELVNNLGILKARRTLNCEKRRGYHFEIIAILCDGSHSIPANVHISVIDINEYAPTFLQPSYVTDVDEGRLYQEILRVEATDKDCTPPYGDVCKYKILNDDEPFTIDNEGSIKNTEPLSHKTSHNHILQVVAYDCAMKPSVPIMASIKVRRVCEAHLIGIPERIDYTANSMESLSLFPKVRIELCDINCNHEDMNIHISVALKTKHISFGCDRDIAQCSKSHTLIDVLPKGTEWTKDLTYDEGSESVFHFDSLSGAVVPESLVAKHDFGSNSFSIIAMFKHNSLSTFNKHAKEHIICSADDHKMNRHHMALFVRNCRLILLIRKNYNEGDLNMFSPAEWRWKIPQVCDNEWHHYVLNVDLPKVELYIDGAKFENTAEDRHSNPEVIDDWPLHAAHGVNTTLTVGACYQGSENRLKHGFNGDIAEIKLLFNKILSSEDIHCGTYCAEHLVPPSEKYIEFEQEVQSNSQFNEIYIEGSNKSNIEQLLSNIQYINTKQNPTIGRRNIEVRTTLTCPNQSATSLPSVETYIMVNEPQLQPSTSLLESAGSSTLSIMSASELISNKSGRIMQSDYDLLKDKPSMSAAQQDSNGNNQFQILSEMYGTNYETESEMIKPNKPKIIISGNPNHLVSYPDIKDGVRILASINITVYSGNEIHQNLQTLDSCSVSVFPSLNPDHEEIALDNDETLSTTLNIKTNINKDGVEMIGYDLTNTYLNVLKTLIYTNKKPAYYLNRVFKLSCSQVNSRFKSAEFILTLTVLHPKQSMLVTTNNPNVNVLKNNNSSNNYNNNNNNKIKSNNMDNELPQQHLLKQHESNVFAHAMVHSHDIQEPKSKIHSIIHKAQSSHPTMLIIVICVFFVVLLCGVSIARIRNSNNKYIETRQPCPKITTEQLDWDDSALTITINPMQNDVLSDESSESENSDSDDEVLNGKYKNVSQLEWDNSTM